MAEEKAPVFDRKVEAAKLARQYLFTDPVTGKQQVALMVDAELRDWLVGILMEHTRQTGSEIATLAARTLGGYEPTRDEVLQLAAEVMREGRSA